MLAGWTLQWSQQHFAGDIDAVKALSIMQLNNASRLIVVKERKLLVILSLKDMLNFLSMKVDLDQI